MRLNLGNIYDDYFEYEIMKKYFIIWYISPDKTYEEEVSVNKYAEALLEEVENNQNPLCIPYSTYVRYYFRMKNMDKFQELCANAPEIYEELYRILYPEKFKYENEIVRHRIKHKKYQKIFVNYFFNGFSQEKIAKMEGLTQQAISHILRVSTNKLKNELEKFEKI